MVKRDMDVENMIRRDLKDEVMKLRTAIRKHMNMRGDDRCVGDDHELYLLLPEGDTRPAVDSAVTLENCKLFIAKRQSGDYVSPQRYIETLESRLQKMQEQLAQIAAAPPEKLTEFLAILRQQPFQIIEGAKDDKVLPAGNAVRPGLTDGTRSSVLADADRPSRGDTALGRIPLQGTVHTGHPPSAGCGDREGDVPAHWSTEQRPLHVLPGALANVPVRDGKAPVDVPKPGAAEAGDAQD